MYLYFCVCLCEREGDPLALLGYNGNKDIQFTNPPVSQPLQPLEMWLQGTMVFLQYLITFLLGKFPV